ncbi:hypothetical protein L3X38_037477 [Prunus dulcis]|uniref:Uncharacterized protein n=1 Tax=Prunus dulcis TaxID=3755 RepID=A0AAD4YQP1_PRUDU|nr:hypothetical protein L3X38_037477 [Prunus dulcis]
MFHHPGSKNVLCMLANLTEYIVLPQSESNIETYTIGKIQISVRFLQKYAVQNSNANLENQLNVLKVSNIVFQNSNNELLTELNEANSKVINLTIGAEKLDKMLNIGKVYGDKSGLGFNGNDSSASSSSTKFIKATISVVSSFGL